MVALLARRISISAPSVFVLACTHRLSYASGVRIITSTAVVPPRWKHGIYMITLLMVNCARHLLTDCFFR